MRIKASAIDEGMRFMLNSTREGRTVEVVKARTFMDYRILTFVDGAGRHGELHLRSDCWVSATN